jgi:3',5'-cyclic-AMP phosphodiesterase
LKEYQVIQNIFSDLKFPIVTVIGNHDMLGNGENVYKKLYGDLNFSFDYKGIRFIFFNSNAMEYDFQSGVPDIDWISSQLVDTLNFKKAILVSHIGFFADDFGKINKEKFISKLSANNKILLWFNGHVHTYYHITKEEGHPFNSLTNPVMRLRMILLVKIYGNEYSVENINF